MSPGAGRPSARPPGASAWTLALLFAACAVALGLWLGASGRVSRPSGDYPRVGRWREAPRAGSKPALSAAEVGLLRSLGYASGSSPAPVRSGVTVHERGAACDGLNLVVSGHEPGAHLLDMDGRELHRWSVDFARVWPEHLGDEFLNARQWRDVALLADGGVVAVHEGIGVVRIDRDSKLVWRRENGAHHQVIETLEGELLALARRIHVVPRIDPKRPIAEDTIEVLSTTGEPRRSISMLSAFERSRFPSELARAKPWGDLFHTNSVQWLDAEPGSAVEPFVRGRVLVSIRELDLLALVDLASEAIVWTARGSWRAQHDVLQLPNGHLLLFDNQGLGERSRVLELDPKTLAVVWSYGERESEHFYSKECGAVQRLDNGNTLVTESEPGRAFEVMPDGRIVWEFTSPWRAGKNHRLVATLYEVRRIAREEVASWLPVARPSRSQPLDSEPSSAP